MSKRKVDHDVDGLSVLTVKELDDASKLVGADVVHAITTPTHKRARALQVVAWKLARRQDKTAALADFEGMTYVQVHDSIYRSACVELGLDPDEEVDVEDDDTAPADELVEPDGPTEPAPEPGADPGKLAELADEPDVDPEVAAHPTAPARGSSSPARGAAPRPKSARSRSRSTSS